METTQIENAQTDVTVTMIDQLPTLTISKIALLILSSIQPRLLSQIGGEYCAIYWTGLLNMNKIKTAKECFDVRMFLYCTQNWKGTTADAIKKELQNRVNNFAQL